MTYSVNTPGANLPREEFPLFGTAAILAGGKSSRMGFDKQLLMEDDKRILQAVIETLKQEFSDILIVTAKPHLYADMDVRLCSDAYPGFGPLAGVHAALSNTRSQYVYLLACDMPVVNLSYIQHMKQKLLETGMDICASLYHDRIEPFNTFYSRSLLGEVVHRLETRNSSLFRFIHASQSCVLSQEEAAGFDKELRMFTNINTRSEYEKYLGSTEPEPEGCAELVDKLDIVRYIGGEYIQLRDLMVHETPLHLEIPGVMARTLYCSPSEQRELVVGHLYTQGYIRGMEDILFLELDLEANSARVTRKETAQARCQKSPKNLVFDPQILLTNQQKFYDQSVLQKATAGTHRCALCDDSGTYFACIDISRHNALDKLTGKALMEGVSLEDKYILTSGRIPMDMILKAASIGIPMIVSRSTPTIAAVETARKAGITLLGFSRENRFNIYSASHRLKGCSLSVPDKAE